MYKMKQMKVAVSLSVVTSASVDFVDVAHHSGQFYSLQPPTVLQSSAADNVSGPQLVSPLVLFTANKSSRHLVTTSLCVQWLNHQGCYPQHLSTRLGTSAATFDVPLWARDVVGGWMRLASRSRPHHRRHWYHCSVLPTGCCTCMCCCHSACCTQWL